MANYETNLKWVIENLKRINKEGTTITTENRRLESITLESRVSAKLFCAGGFTKVASLDQQCLAILDGRPVKAIALDDSLGFLASIVDQPKPVSGYSSESTAFHTTQLRHVLDKNDEYLTGQFILFWFEVHGDNVIHAIQAVGSDQFQLLVNDGWTQTIDTSTPIIAIKGVQSVGIPWRDRDGYQINRTNESPRIWRVSSRALQSGEHIFANSASEAEKIWIARHEPFPDDIKNNLKIEVLEVDPRTVVGFGSFGW